MDWESFLGASEVTRLSHMTGGVRVVITLEITTLVTAPHLMQGAGTPETIDRIRIFWLLILFLICLYSCVNILISILILSLRSRALLSLLPLPLRFCASIFGDY